MLQSMLRSLCPGLLLTFSTCGTFFLLSPPAVGQITPDNSLGAESSFVTPNIEAQAGSIDRIDGGAIRGDALFHSFAEFNVNGGQRVYFANPEAIDRIFSRVTGGNASEIFGTLGVLGNADLYLINPGGVYFGPDAQLDIRGSFVGSTTDALVFDTGYAFSAIAPDAPPLLTINSSLGLANWLPPTTGTIASTGQLSVAEHLALAGNVLNLQGELTAGADLTLQATDTLTIRDKANAPFIATAGNAMTIQGNQSLDIAALSHPDSGFFAIGDLVLRSDQHVLADAHFSAGGFRVERLDGSPGAFTSPNDPVVRASGDVNFGSYEGASLHILAGGSIQADSISITGPDTTGNALQEQVTLSDGVTTVAIDGSATPSLDLRAGTLAFGIPGTTPTPPAGFSPSAPDTAGGATGADITVTNIRNPGGLAFLTNQYQPNLALSGDIAIGNITTATDPASGLDGGQVVMDSRGGLTFNNIDTSGGDFATFTVGGNGGDITLLAQQDIFMPFPSSIYTYGLRGGAITFSSGTAIIQENGPLGSDPFSLSWIETNTFDPVRGSDIRFTAPSIAIGGNITSSNEGEGRGGDIILSSETLTTNQATVVAVQWFFGGGAAGDVNIISTDSLNNGIFSFIGSFNFSDLGGQGGNVDIQADSIQAEAGGQIGSLTFGLGDAGDVSITAKDVVLSGFVPEELAVPLAGGQFRPSGFTSSAQGGSEGNSGTLTINTGTLTMTGGAALFTQSFGIGDAGDIAVNASESISLSGAVFPEFANINSQPTAINSEIAPGAVGQGGNIEINTPVLNVTEGATISAVSDGDGNAGSILIDASESVLVDGIVPFAQVGQRDRISQIAVFTAENSTGNGGNLTLIAPALTLTNNGQLTAETLGVGNAGNVKVDISDTIFIDGEGSGILSNTAVGSTGQGGSINIDPRLVIVQNGGQIAVNSLGTGQAGNLFIEAGTLLLDRGLISAETLSSTGGNITLRIADLVVLLNNSRISTTAGTALAGGDGGNLDINTTYLVAAPDTGNSDITANAFAGAGGNVLITAEGIFGIAPLSRAELETLLGTTDPLQLDPANLATNDITAISRENPELEGQVEIITPDTDPSAGLDALPDNIIDASRYIAQGCASEGALAQEIGSLILTGRGGLPPNPGDNLTGNQLLLDWATAEAAGPPLEEAEPTASAPTTSEPLQEVQSLALNGDGQVVLIAQAPGNAPHMPSLTCKGDIVEE